jgi:hypothetical protein
MMLGTVLVVALGLSFILVKFCEIVRAWYVHLSEI